MAALLPGGVRRKSAKEHPIWARSALDSGPSSVPDSGGSATMSGTTAEVGRGTAVPLHDANGRSTLTLAREESMQQISEAIATVESHITTTEGDIKRVQQALVSGEVYKGKGGDALEKEEERLARKEYQLRDKEKLLRDEKVTLLRSNIYGAPEGEWC